jgi:type I restriction enzyme, S subunit
MKLKHKLAPTIRFPGFTEPWEEKKVESILQRQSLAVDVNLEEAYTQIGIRSHGKGIFHKESVTGESLGNKRVFWVQPDCLILNIVFAWEQAVAKSTENEIGLIASHRFPMFEPVEGEIDIDFIVTFFLRPRGKRLLGLASPGGAGRNRTLGQKDFEKLKVIVPKISEQERIMGLLKSVDTWIQTLIQKKALLQEYKKGVMQQLFSQEIRFKDDHGDYFPDWKKTKLESVLHEHKEKSAGTETVYSVSVKKGLVNQVEHLGRSYAAASTAHYNRVNPNDVVYTKSPTGNFPLGIIKQSHVTESVIVSPLYAVFRPKTPGLGRLIEVYFESPCNVHNYLYSLIQKGVKNTFSINNSTFLSKSLLLPVSQEEQRKIGDFFAALDQDIDLAASKIARAQDFKRGLLQQMFV